MIRFVFCICILSAGCYGAEYRIQTTKQAKAMSMACGCPTMEGCTKCCSPEACTCRNITGR